MELKRNKVGVDNRRNFKIFEYLFKDKMKTYINSCK